MSAFSGIAVPARGEATVAGDGTRRAAADRPSQVVAVKYWAFVGGVFVVFIAYVMISWVTGPYFKRVPAGPTPVPEYMKVSLLGLQIVTPAIWFCLVYRLVVRPWRRERQVGTDGLFVLAGATVFWQDPLANYFNHWFTYNSYALNWGSWVNEIPGWMAYGQPGRMLPEPATFIVGAHGFFWLLYAVVGSWIMRALQARRSTIGIPVLLLATFLISMVVDTIVEGFVWMLAGNNTYAGGPCPCLFPNTYHRWPINEAVFVGLVGVAVAALYHFRNDQGQMWIERGLDHVRGGPLKKALLRVLALTAALNLVVLAVYNVPQAFLFASKSREWPRDVQSRSYFLDGICGAGTNRACPGPGVPLNRADGGDQTGALLAPGATSGRGVTIPQGRIPAAVPLSHKPEGPFTGPIFSW